MYLKNDRDLSIIIPAAGMGRRMKAYGPKPLIPLGVQDNETVIGRQQCILRKLYPFSQIIVVVGYEADMVMNHLDDTIAVENEMFEQTNVVRSIAMGLRAVSPDCKNVLIVYGDLVFNKETVTIPHYIISKGLSAAIVGQMGDEEVGVTIVDGRITQCAYDLDTKWAQIVYLTGRELDIFKRVVWNRNHARWFGFEALNAVLHNGGILHAISPRGMKIAEIDTAKDIEKARNIIL